MSRGKVKWFDAKKGYGFIQWDDGKDVFIHYTEIQTNQPFKKVEEGELVDFDLVVGEKGLQAKKVMVIR